MALVKGMMETKLAALVGSWSARIGPCSSSLVPKSPGI